MSEKKSLIYSIYSPSLDEYYIGSTTCKLSLRKAIHKYQCKLNNEGKFKNIKSFKIIRQGDAEYKVIKSFDSISKKELLNEETKEIIFMKLMHGDKILNKNNSGLTLNIKEYNRQKSKKYYENHKEERSIYFKKKYQEKKHLLKAKRNEKKLMIKK